MTNDSSQAGSRQITVPFYGANLLLIEHNGQPYTPMKPIVAGMGVSWHGQFEKLAANAERWSVRNIRMVAEDGKQREQVCIPLRKLAGWLMTMEPNKIKRHDARARVIQYQNECDDVLWQYWTEGVAVNERMAFSVNPGDVLTADQQETLRLMVKTLTERLPKAKQGPAAIRMWSKLKAHFKVAYRQIPQGEFSEAVSIVTRTAAEWELVDDRAPAAGRYHFPLATADVHDREFRNTWLTPRRLLDPANRAPEIELLRQLEADGYDVSGAKIRILAMRQALERYEFERANLAAASKRMRQFGEWLRNFEMEQGKNVLFGSEPNPDDPVDRRVYRDQMRRAG